MNHVQFPTSSEVCGLIDATAGPPGPESMTVAVPPCIKWRVKTNSCAQYQKHHFSIKTCNISWEEVQMESEFNTAQKRNKRSNLLISDCHVSWRRSRQSLWRKSNRFTPPNLQFIVIHNNTWNKSSNMLKARISDKKAFQVPINNEQTLSRWVNTTWMCTLTLHFILCCLSICSIHEGNKTTISLPSAFLFCSRPHNLDTSNRSKPTKCPQKKILIDLTP